MIEMSVNRAKASASSGVLRQFAGGEHNSGISKSSLIFRFESNSEKILRASVSTVGASECYVLKIAITDNVNRRILNHARSPSLLRTC